MISFFKQYPLEIYCLIVLPVLPVLVVWCWQAYNPREAYDNNGEVVVWSNTRINLKGNKGISSEAACQDLIEGKSIWTYKIQHLGFSVDGNPKEQCDSLTYIYIINSIESRMKQRPHVKNIKLDLELSGLSPELVKRVSPEVNNYLKDHPPHEGANSQKSNEDNKIVGVDIFYQKLENIAKKVDRLETKLSNQQ